MQDIRSTLNARHSQDRQYSIPVDGQARNPGLPSLRECISRSYGQARWLYELPGMATDPESDEWADGVKTIRIPRHLGIGVGTSRQGPPHCITSIQAGSLIARNGSALVGEFITHIDTISTATMHYSELHRALQECQNRSGQWSRIFFLEELAH